MSLYPRLLGPSWGQLADPIRAIHAGDAIVRAHGRLHIVRGSTRMARAVAWLLRLPRAQRDADTRLVITPHAGGERWLRTFGGRRLDSWQHAGPGGELVERIGILELGFILRASEIEGARSDVPIGSLLFQQRSATLGCGPIRWRLPVRWTPTVEAREEAAGPGAIHVRVRVAVPAIGTLLVYDGVMFVEEMRP